jgi:SM-20-related protein
MIDYLEIADVLDEAACGALCAEIRAASGEPAGLLGRAEQKPAWPEIRRTTRAAVSEATEALVTALLAKQKAALQQHFGVALGACERPSFFTIGKAISSCRTRTATRRSSTMSRGSEKSRR